VLAGETFPLLVRIIGWGLVAVPAAGAVVADAFAGLPIGGTPAGPVLDTLLVDETLTGLVLGTLPVDEVLAGPELDTVPVAEPPVGLIDELFAELVEVTLLLPVDETCGNDKVSGPMPGSPLSLYIPGLVWSPRPGSPLSPLPLG
jgi:hypothetical protein